MLPTRNVSVKTRVKEILASLPAEGMFTLDDIKDAIRASGVKSRVAINDYRDIHLKAYIVEEGKVYRLK